MAFVTGLFLIDAPASALNNLGSTPGEREDNTVGVKMISTKAGNFPYVSAQAFRYWLRTTLERRVSEWKASPIFREEKIAYTDANPIKYWDDDLFGYMRAPGKSDTAKKSREQMSMLEDATPVTDTITRASPLRVSTLVSIVPVNPTSDFGVMSRHEGNPVPHEHQFYRTTLKGLFSLDLWSCGTFSYLNRTGFRNLDDERLNLIRDYPGAEHLEAEKSYRLPKQERLTRVKALFSGMAQLEGGAKQTLHYTDVSSALVMFAVTDGGNHIFHHTVGANRIGQPEIKIDALREALRVFADGIRSPVYVGWVKGYLDDARAAFEQFVAEHNANADANGLPRIELSHPREAFLSFVAACDTHPEWLD
ncbi:type I-B CRISPR-associated protein Cas7/Cst2/DevR [Chloroflexus sp.]|uniref:type I-B CRISPR-associated protein Cas7/Cst2/DevR n=1 Tax=Chloroflexus sp. TaxID=1904827 RepID=UPI002ACE5201|nr:type I-B CRISPR-associated protein Cas7/Cst2/DevR [Chloroflexus sp.]